jgi:hypothetical protein
MSDGQLVKKEADFELGVLDLFRWGKRSPGDAAGLTLPLC